MEGCRFLLLDNLPIFNLFNMNQLRKKRIGVFLGIKTSAGGMFQYIESILDALTLLQKQNYEIYVAYTYPVWESVLTQYSFKTQKISAGVFGIKLSDFMSMMRIPGAFSRMISSIFNPVSFQLSRLKCDLWIFPAQDSIGYQTREVAIVTIHDLMHLYEPSFPEVSSNGRRLIRDHRFSNLAAYGSAILVDSEIGKGHVMESYGTSSNKIFSLPYMPPSYIYRNVDMDSFNKRYILPDKYIFYPAQFWEHKNHKRLIEAASKIAHEAPDIALVFTGGQDKAYKDIKKYVKSIHMQDRITFAGYVSDSDIVGFYKRARAMIMPTFFGPTNIPPLEAFVCGCPVAVSNIYGMPNQVGDAALLFNPNSVNEISNVMLDLWNDDDLCVELVDKGYKKVAKLNLENFSKSLDNIISTVDSLYV